MILARALSVVAAALALARTLVASTMPGDAVDTFGNALTAAGLTVALLALLRRWLVPPRALVAVLVAVGLARAAFLSWGVQTGWMETWRIEAGGQEALSVARARDIDFGAGRVPAHLVNDSTRFNFFRPGDPIRAKLPVGLVAEAYLAVPVDLVISASSAVTVRVGGESVASLVGSSRASVVALRPVGEQVVQVTLAPVPLDDAALTVQVRGGVVTQTPAGGRGFATFRSVALPVLDALALLALGALAGVGLWRRRGVFRSPEVLLRVILAGGVCLAFVGPQVATWYQFHDRIFVLPGGDDALQYETQARDIYLNSPLMLSGEPIGHAAPFYTQAFYPYALALDHLIAGESVMGAVLIQILVVAVIVALAFVAVPSSTAVLVSLAGVLALTGVVLQWADLAGTLLSENLLLLVYALLLAAAARLGGASRTRLHLAIGALLGLAILVRATEWLAVPFFAVVLWRVSEPARRRRAAGAFLLALLLVAAFVPVRNLIATGVPTLMPTSGSISLAFGNVPEGRVIADEPWRSWAERFDPYVIATLEYASHEPAAFASGLARKAAYVLGFARATGRPFEPSINWSVLALWVLLPLGLLVRTRTPLFAVAVILMTLRSLVLVLIIPDSYYYRHELPAMLPLAIIDALGISALVARLRPSRPPSGRSRGRPPPPTRPRRSARVRGST